MMEKRNFVTTARTQMEGAGDIDEILKAGSSSFKNANRYVKTLAVKVDEADEKSDKGR